MTTEEIDKLFADTLLGDHDDDAPWAAVSQLRSDGDRYIFEKAKEWCNNHDPKFRSRGADVLSQLRAPRAPGQGPMTASKPIFVEESFEILARMVPAETDDDALSSELFGLGHLYKPEAVPILVQYSGHRNEDVRFAVACSLGHFSQDPSSVEHLVGLADDPDSDVRNWTLFALGSQSDVDSAELRDIFARHLNDSDPDSREEALAGLAKRKDSRAALPLLQLMLAGSYYSHHDYDFKALVDEPDDADWGTEDFIDALYERFPDLLPPRGNS